MGITGVDSSNTDELLFRSAFLDATKKFSTMLKHFSYLLIFKQPATQSGDILIW
jgi:hypothetical protein